MTELPSPYYQDSAVTIFHGDCREFLPLLGRFDLLLTDPKYGIGADSAAAKNNGKWGWKYYGNTNWDTERTPADLIRVALASSDEAIIWGGNYFSDVLPPSQGWIVWDKAQRNFSLSDGELAWTSFDNALRILTIPRGRALRDGKEHPTQKSVEVIVGCIGYADRNNATAIKSIIDPFLGSGTTLRAAKDLGRRAIGIEIEERYCEIAAKRMEQECFDFCPVKVEEHLTPLLIPNLVS